MTITERRKRLIYDLCAKHKFKILNLSINKDSVWITNLEVSRFINNNYFNIEMLANNTLGNRIDSVFLDLANSSKNTDWHFFLMQNNIKESEIKAFIIDLVSMLAWNQGLFKTSFDYTVVDSSIKIKNKDHLNNRGLIVIYRNN